MSTQTQEACEVFVLGWLTLKGKKYDSPENRLRIIERVISYGIHPSETAVIRAITELVQEGQIQRVDGKTAEDDAREVKRAAEDRDRRAALATPLTEADASLYASMAPVEIAEKFHTDRVFQFRYEAASRLWGFRIPTAQS